MRDANEVFFFLFGESVRGVLTGWEEGLKG